MQNMNVLFQAVRIRNLLLLLSPLIPGFLLAWKPGSTLQWQLFVLTVCGILTAYLAASIINKRFSPSTIQTAHHLNTPTPVNATNKQTNVQSPLQSMEVNKDDQYLVGILLSIAFLCGIVLSWFRPWTIILGGISLLLTYSYIVPPLRLSQRGRGYGEIEIFLLFGVLPLLEVYYIQAGTISLVPIYASLPLGLYITTVFYFNHFLYWRSDQVTGKITLIAQLGEHKARIVGAFLIVLISPAILLNILLGVFPWYACITVLTTLPVLVSLWQATRDSRNYTQLLFIDISATIQATLLLCLALFIRSFLGI